MTRCWLCLLLLFVVAPASAQTVEEQASAHFRDATAAFERQEYRHAAGLFLEAYELAPRPEALLNAAVAFDQAGVPAQAADLFERSVRDERLASPDRKMARERLLALRQIVAWVTFEGPDGTKVSVAHLQGVKLPHRGHLAAGEHVIVYRGQRGAKWLKRIEVEPGTVRRIDAAEGQLANSGTGDLGPAPPAAIAQVPQDATRRQRTTRALGWAAAGIGALAGVTGAVLGANALAAKRNFDDSGHTDAGARGRAARLRTSSNVALGIGTALGVLGGTLILAPAIKF